MVRHGRHDSDDEAAPEPPAAGESTLAGYRLLRRIASGERADVFLAAVDRPNDAEADAEGSAQLVTVRVYEAAIAGTTIATEIEAMSTDASGSLPELFDVATLDDGRCALAVERLPGPSVARLLAERTLAPGEAVTILAPIVVAVAELARRGFVHTRLSPGDVLLDDRGRPRLIGLGGLERLPVKAHERTQLLRTGHVALAELVDAVSAATRPAEQLIPVAELLRDRLAARPFTSCEDEIERRLFDAAAPVAVSGVAMRTRRNPLPTRVTAPIDMAAVASHSHGVETDAREVRPRTFVKSLLELAQWPAALAGRAAPTPGEPVRGAAGTGRLRAALQRRRPALVVGTLVGGGALALLLTLVPPATAGTDEAVARPDRESPSALDRDEADESREPSADEQAARSDEPDRAEEAGVAPSAMEVVPAATALLQRRAECFEALDLECLSEVLQPGSTSESDDVAAMIAAREGADVPRPFDTNAITVAAEMGSAVLLTVPYAGAEREPASLLLMRGEAGWRLREIFG